MSEELTTRTFSGAAKAVITPPVGYPMGNWGLRQGKAIGVHKDLHVRSVVFKRAETAIAIISLEIAGLTSQTVKDIKTKILALTGIQPDSVLLNFTHTHTWKKYFSKYFQQKTSDDFFCKVFTCIFLNFWSIFSISFQHLA